MGDNTVLCVVYILSKFCETRIMTLKKPLVKARKIGYTNRKSAKMKVTACSAFFREPVVGGNR